MDAKRSSASAGKAALPHVAGRLLVRGMLTSHNVDKDLNASLSAQVIGTEPADRPNIIRTENTHSLCVPCSNYL